MAASALKVLGSRFEVSHFTPHAPRITHHVLRVAYFVVLFASFVYSLAFVSIYTREHPWLTISRWMYANIPARATIAVEHWDDVLPVPMRFGETARAPGDYTLLTLPMYDADDATKLETIINALHDAEYIVLATQRLAAPITRLAARYPLSSRYYRALFDGQLGFELVASATNGIALDGVLIVDDRLGGLTRLRFAPDALVWNWGYADESFTVYDHPLPLVFKKTRALSRDELRAQLSP